MSRANTRVVKIGDRVIGGGNPILIQSMTNTKTEDVEATVKQIQALTEAGCDIIRCAVPTMEAARALSEIKKQISIPLVADIHFDYRLAIAAIENGADKIRINPGNIGSRDRIQAVVDAAKERQIPIRVGVNSGSLEKELVEKYNGVTAEGLVESALDKVRIIDPRRVIAEVRCPEVAGELIAEVNIEDGVHQPGVRNQTKGINPAFRHRLRGAERHADVIGVFAEPAAEGDLDAARAAGFQKVDECRKEPNADFIGAAPVIGIPDRQEQPFFFRGLGQQVGECVDADGIIAAFFDVVEDSVPVLKACAVPAAFNP